MSPEITRRKLNFLIECLDELKTFKKADIKTINENHLKIERLLHLSVEIAGDINYHLIVKKFGKPPKDLYTSFIQIGDMGIIPSDLAQNLAPAAGLRNALVHMYDKIEMDFIQKSIEMALTLFPIYLRHIEESLK